MSMLRSEATNPAQYDVMDTDWHIEGAYDSPVRTWIREYLQPVLAYVEPKRVLDIGCGTGWLARTVLEQGAETYVGVDPAAANIDFARQSHPGGRFVHSTAEAFTTDETFDLVSCIMATEHIDNLDQEFARWRQFLNDDGHLLIIAASMGWFTRQRFDYTLTVEGSDDEKVVRASRPDLPSTTDVVRSLARFNHLASKHGFLTKRHMPMKPTRTLTKARPKYAQYRQVPLFQLLLYKKMSDNH